MRFYVGRSVEATMEVLWEGYGKDSTTKRGERKVDGESCQERDTLRDTSHKSAQNDQEPPDVSSTSSGS